MNKATATRMFNELVDALANHYDNDTKTNIELIAIGNEVFKPLKNNVMRNADYDFYKMSNQYSIVNTDNNEGVHWVGVYQERNNVYVFDTFGRNIISLMPEFHKRARTNGYIIFKANGKYEHEQEDVQNDCGLRSLAWLILTHSKGINVTKKI